MTYVLIHGAATNSSVWASTAAVLEATGSEVVVPDRPQTGDLEEEIAYLEPLCADAILIGVSGGATLGLELAARGAPLAAAWLHEPAAGSLAPGLLAHVASGLETGGVRGFGAALYGPSWNPGHTDRDEATIRAEFRMFGAFEPSPLRVSPHRVVLTTGSESPPSRRASVTALADFLGVAMKTLHGTSHSAHLDGAYDLATVRELHQMTDDVPPAGEPR